MEFPFVYEFANTLPNVSEAFASMVFGRGGELIDEEKNPLWTDPNSPAAQQLKWLVDAKNDAPDPPSMPHETDITQAMNTGQHAFTVMFNYNLAALNNAATSALAGQFKLAHDARRDSRMLRVRQVLQHDPDGGGPRPGDDRRDSATSSSTSPARSTASTRSPSAGRWSRVLASARSAARRSGRAGGVLEVGRRADSGGSSSRRRVADGRRSGTASGARQFHPLLGRALNGEISADQALEDAANAWNDLKSRVEG